MARKKNAEFWVVEIDQGEIGATPVSKKMNASEAECALVAKRLEIPSVQNLSSEITLYRTPGNKAIIQAEGVLKADVTQSCVITHKPVKQHIEEEFEAWYADPESFVSFNKVKNERRASKSGEQEVQALDEREDPEPIVNGKIDLGDLVSQYLSLALDPYPKAYGAEWENDDKPEAIPEGATDASLRRNPFAALKDLKGSKE